MFSFYQNLSKLLSNNLIFVWNFLISNSIIFITIIQYLITNVTNISFYFYFIQNPKHVLWKLNICLKKLVLYLLALCERCLHLEYFSGLHFLVFGNSVWMRENVEKTLDSDFSERFNKIEPWKWNNFYKNFTAQKILCKNCL